MMSEHILRYVALPCSWVAGWQASCLSSEVRSSPLALRPDLPTASMEFLIVESSAPKFQRLGE
jgi:hypothetical protein